MPIFVSSSQAIRNRLQRELSDLANVHVELASVLEQRGTLPDGTPKVFIEAIAIIGDVRMRLTGSGHDPSSACEDVMRVVKEA